MVSGGFFKECVWTCPGYLCIPLHNSVQRILRGMCLDWSRVSFFAYNNYTQWCPEDSVRNVSRQVQDVFSLHTTTKQWCPEHSSELVWTSPRYLCIPLHNGVRRIPQGKYPDRSGMSFLRIQQLNNGVGRIPQGMCPDRSGMSLHTTTTQWCTEDSSRYVSRQVQLHYSAWKILKECVRTVTGCFFFEIYNLWWFLVMSMTT